MGQRLRRSVDVKMSMKELGWWKRLQINRGNPVPVGKQTRLGWSGSLMFYAFKCDKHGIVESYLQGHSKTLRCPKCQEEEN